MVHFYSNCPMTCVTLQSKATALLATWYEHTCAPTHTLTHTISLSLCETHWKQTSWRQPFTHFYSIFHLHEYTALEKKGIWCWKRSRKEKILHKKFAFSTTSACTCKHVRDCGWVAEDYKAYKALVKTAIDWTWHFVLFVSQPET